MSKALNINEFINKKFGRLLAIGEGDKNKNRRTIKCLCDCGGIKNILPTSLRNGYTKSCGCLSIEHKNNFGNKYITHNQTNKNSEFSSEYKIFRGIKERCYNPNNPAYKNYGGRGITLCNRWLEPNGQGFINFLNDVGQRPTKKHSIDRFPDKNGNYTPDNCRWATDSEQVRNRRNTKLIEYNNEIKSLAEWCEIFNIKYHSAFYRLNKNWTLDKVFEISI